MSQSQDAQGKYADFNCPQFVDFFEADDSIPVFFDELEEPVADSAAAVDLKSDYPLTPSALQISRLEDDHPYDLRLTPSRSKRRGTGIFSSKKKRSLLHKLQERSRESSPKCLMLDSQLDDESFCDSLDESSVSRKSKRRSSHSKKSESLIDSDTENYPIQRANFNNEKPSPAQKLRQKTRSMARSVSVPQPFRLTESKKRRHESEEYVPLAEQVAMFHKKTPKRFRSSRRNVVFEAPEHWSPELVKPQSPNLNAAKRTRRVTVLSRDEEEEQQLEKMKEYKFQAQPYDPEKFKNQSKKPVEFKASTKPVEVVLETEKRSAVNYGRKVTEEETYEFHAQPVPKGILKGCVGLKEKKTIPLTHPKSPYFTLKDRSKAWKVKTVATPEPVFPRFRAQTPQSLGKPFTIKHEWKVTEMEPFSFDAKDKERFAKKEQRIQEELEKDNVFIFKAQPMPSPLPSTLPKIPKRKLTVVEPFSITEQISSDKRNLQNMLHEDLEKQKAASFKARPAKVLRQEPFVPVKAATYLPVSEFTLHTDIRASERLRQREEKEAMDAQMEPELRLEEQRREMQRQKELVEYRKRLVHKAQPIRQFKEVEIKQSSKELTKPISPKFAARQKSRSPKNV